MLNQWITSEYTSTLQKLIREVVNDPSTYLGSKYMPSIALPMNKIRTEIIEATGGLTNEHKPGTAVNYIRSFGTRVQEYTPPKYKEAIHYDEEKILYLRELGNSNLGARGVQQYIDLDIDRLNRRLEARIELLRWQTIFNGQFSWFGTNVSFGIPANNKATPVGAAWDDGAGNANASADPLKDIRFWLMGGLPQFRKYKISKAVINPNTARWILDNPNVQSLVQTYFSADSFGDYSLNKVVQMIIPGAPEFEIYDGWYQDESVSAEGKIEVSDAIYFIDDGQIYFEVSNLPGGDKIGEFVQGVHLADGSIQTPGYGKFIVIDDNTVKGSKGGPGNPFLDLIAGVYGGPKLDRPFDVLTANVKA